MKSTIVFERELPSDDYDSLSVQLRAPVETYDPQFFDHKLTLIRFSAETSEEDIDIVAEGIEDSPVLMALKNATFVITNKDVTLESIDPHSIPADVRKRLIKRLMDAWAEEA